MSSEAGVTSIILKKQPFGEADEIITLFTLEQGKLRVLAKSSKLAKSKLQHALQPLSMATLTITSRGNLPKVIHAQTEQMYAQLKQDVERVQAWFVAAELIMKATPDQQKNEQLFFLSKEFMDTLNAEKQLEGAFVSAALAKFKIHFLDVLGFGVWVPADMSLVPNHFSNTIGGFVGGRANADAYAIDAHTWELFNLLKQSAWHALPVAGELAELQHILSNFIEFQLEREIKSEHYLEQY